MTAYDPFAHLDPFDDEMSQADQVLSALRRGPVCNSQMLRHYISRGADVIFKLRSRGHAIASEVCTDPAHRHRKGSQLASYTLLGEWDPQGGLFGEGAWSD